jgi:hypothetical protein
LAAKYALPKIFELFLQKNGNPCLVNSHLQNCLHSVCIYDNQFNNDSLSIDQSHLMERLRCELMTRILRWEGIFFLI